MSCLDYQIILYYTDVGVYPKGISILKVRLSNDLLLINITSIILIILIIVFPSSWLRGVIGAPFVIFFSGYTLIPAFSPRSSAFSGLRRIALSFGMSIALAPLMGLFLNISPWGFSLYPLLIALAILIFVASVLAQLRRRQLNAMERFSVSITFKVSPNKRD